MCFKELFNGVCVPFCNWECFNNIFFFIEQFNNRISASHIFDDQIGEFSRSIAFDKGLNLWIGAKLASAHLQNGFWESFCCWWHIIFFAAFVAVFSVWPSTKLELFRSEMKKIEIEKNIYLISLSPKVSSLSQDEHINWGFMKPKSRQSWELKSAFDI